MLVETGSCSVAQNDLELTTNDPSALASQNAGITGLSHRAQVFFPLQSIRFNEESLTAFSWCVCLLYSRTEAHLLLSFTFTFKSQASCLLKCATIYLEYVHNHIQTEDF